MIRHQRVLFATPTYRSFRMIDLSTDHKCKVDHTIVLFLLTFVIVNAEDDPFSKTRWDPTGYFRFPQGIPTNTDE
jgi:hypothetical protein